MKRVYVYKHHEGFDIYLSLKEKNAEECYCPLCEDSDKLSNICDTEEELSEVLKYLVVYEELRLMYPAEQELVNILKEVGCNEKDS